MSKMTKTLAVLAAVAGLSLGTLAAPQAAQAHSGHHHHHGGAFFGGFVGGALIGSALYAPYYYASAPYYYSSGPYYYGSGCFWTRTRVQRGGVLRWHRVWVCE
jgi:hypothetical protein